MNPNVVGNNSVLVVEIAYGGPKAYRFVDLAMVQRRYLRGETAVATIVLDVP